MVSFHQKGRVNYSKSRLKDALDLGMENLNLGAVSRFHLKIVAGDI